MAEITDVRIYKIEGTGNLRAYATITLDNAYVVHGLKVMEGESGLWVSMPASKNKKGEFKDIFHPINREAREVLVNTIIQAYEKGEPPKRTEGEEE
ncbi:MAG: septation regulator SpoVG [Methanobacteriota archaeon]